MIEEYASGIARQMGIMLSNVSLVNGQSLGCKNTFLLNMFAQGYKGCSILDHKDLRELENGMCCDRLEVKIRITLARLKITRDSGRCDGQVNCM